MCLSVRGPQASRRGPKRIIEWVSKAWTEFEKELPVFYREALARLLCLEHFRNLIETQSLDAGTIVYTDHALSHATKLGGEAMCLARCSFGDQWDCFLR